MAGEAKLEFLAETTDLLRGMNTLISANARMTKEIQKGASESRKADFAAKSAAQAKAKALRDEERQLERINRERDKFRRGVGGGIAGGLGGMGFGGMLGSAGAIGGVGAAMMAHNAAMEKGADLTKGFAKEMTGLLSLGSNTAPGKIEDVTSSVLALSIAHNVAREAAANMFFQIEQDAAHLPDAIQKALGSNSIELSKLTGSPLEETTRSLIKTFNIYGAELDGVNDLQNKLLNTAERGSLEYKDLATYLASVISPAKALGHSLDDVLASLTVATRYGGRTEETFTGVRNVFLRMNQAIEEGIVKKGPLLDMFDQLAKVDVVTLNKVFGEQAITPILNLSRNAGDVRSESSMSGALEGDLALDRLSSRFRTDAAYRFSETQGSIEKAGEAETINQFSGISSKKLDADTERKLRSNLNTAMLGVGNEWIGTIAEKANDFENALQTAFGAEVPRSGYTKLAIEHQLQSMESAGAPKEQVDILNRQWNGDNADRAASSAQAYFSGRGALMPDWGGLGPGSRPKLPAILAEESPQELADSGATRQSGWEVWEKGRGQSRGGAGDQPGDGQAAHRSGVSSARRKVDPTQQLAVAADRFAKAVEKFEKMGGGTRVTVGNANILATDGQKREMGQRANQQAGAGRR